MGSYLCAFLFLVLPIYIASILEGWLLTLCVKSTDPMIIVGSVDLTHYVLTAIYLRRNNDVSCVYEVISSLKYILKVKLNPNSYPNILSEIIALHENEGSRGNLAQISN